MTMAGGGVFFGLGALDGGVWGRGGSEGGLVGREGRVAGQGMDRGEVEGEVQVWNGDGRGRLMEMPRITRRHGGSTSCSVRYHCELGNTILIKS